MSTPFLITGIPRSRTAWFSVVTTTPKSICYHEPTSSLDSFEALRDLWADDRFPYVGVSDSSLVMQLGRILQEVEPRVLIIDRAPEEAARSFDCYMSGSGRNFRPHPICVALHEELQRYRAHPSVFWLDYDAVSDIEAVAEAIAWIIPDVTFPKLEELMHMNVQADRDWVIEKAKHPHTNWHLDMSWRSRA